jgi:hypothetical protein
MQVDLVIHEQMVKSSRQVVIIYGVAWYFDKQEYSTSRHVCQVETRFRQSALIYLLLPMNDYAWVFTHHVCLLSCFPLLGIILALIDNLTYCSTRCTPVPSNVERVIMYDDHALWLNMVVIGWRWWVRYDWNLTSRPLTEKGSSPIQINLFLCKHETPSECLSR